MATPPQYAPALEQGQLHSTKHELVKAELTSRPHTPMYYIETTTWLCIITWSKQHMQPSMQLPSSPANATKTGEEHGWPLQISMLARTSGMPRSKAWTVHSHKNLGGPIQFLARAFHITASKCFLIHDSMRGACPAPTTKQTFKGEFPLGCYPVWRCWATLPSHWWSTNSFKCITVYPLLSTFSMINATIWFEW